MNPHRKTTNNRQTTTTNILCREDAMQQHQAYVIQSQYHSNRLKQHAIANYQNTTRQHHDTNEAQLLTTKLLKVYLSYKNISFIRIYFG